MRQIRRHRALAHHPESTLAVGSDRLRTAHDVVAIEISDDATDLDVTGAPDHEHKMPVHSQTPRVDLHLPHERTGRVDQLLPGRPKAILLGLADPVSGDEDPHRIRHRARPCSSHVWAKPR